VKQADMRIDPLYHLAVELEDEAEYAMCGRVLRPEIDGELAVAFALAAIGLCIGDRACHVANLSQAMTFSPTHLPA
jgi:hypothetical protein